MASFLFSLVGRDWVSGAWAATVRQLFEKGFMAQISNVTVIIIACSEH